MAEPDTEWSKNPLNGPPGLFGRTPPKQARIWRGGDWGRRGGVYMDPTPGAMERTVDQFPVARGGLRGVANQTVA